MPTPQTQLAQEAESNPSDETADEIIVFRETVDLAKLSEALCFIPCTLSISLTLDNIAFHYLSSQYAEPVGPMPVINAKDIPQLIDQGVLQKVYHPVNVVDFDAKLDSHGYEVHMLPENLMSRLSQLDSYLLEHPFDHISLNMTVEIQSHMAQMLEAYFEGYTVISVDLVYRNTDPNIQAAFRQIPLSHIDFSRDKLAETMKCFEKQWKPFFDAKKCAYDATSVAKMVNVWMPLARFGAFPLGIHQIDAIKKEKSAKSAEYRGVRRDGSSFVAKALVDYAEAVHSSHWRYFPFMPFGAAFMFESMRTPHSAFSFPDSDDIRRSCEGRFFLIPN